MTAATKALLIVDAQQGLLSGEHAVPSAADIVERLEKLLATARHAGALIVHLQNDGAPGTVDEPGAPGWFIHPEVAPAPNELVIRKTQDDGFRGTELDSVVSRCKIKRIAIAGLLSEMCVSATARGALARGLQVVIVHDAHATYDLDEIPAHIVSRVAEHALGDEIEVTDVASIVFEKAQCNS